jgi:CRP-like cAMP-binding protein
MNKNNRQMYFTENRVVNINSSTQSPFITTKTANEPAENKRPAKILNKFTSDGFFKNKLLATLSDKFNDLLPFFEHVLLSKNESIYRQDEEIYYIYFPETLVISEFQMFEDGKTMEIAMIGKEGVIGLLPCFRSSRAVNWTQVLLGGTAFRIKTKILANAGFQSHLQSLLLNYIGSYAHQISQRTICNCFHTVEERFCTWLLMLQNRWESNELPLTQELIAFLLGVHRPSLTLVANGLRTKGIIDYVRGKIIIRDQRKLKQSACDCYLEIDRNFINY